MKTIEEKFNEAVRRGQKVYKSKSPEIQGYLKAVKEKVAIENKDIKPYITNPAYYVCDTCGAKGIDHPGTSYCFICNTDNFTRIND